MKVEGRIFFFIKYEHIRAKSIYPYHLFIYNPYNGTFTPFLNGNSPLIKKKRAFLEYLLHKGAIIALDTNQKKTFLNDINIAEPVFEKSIEKDPSLKKYTLEQREHSRVTLKELTSKKRFKIEEELCQSFETSDFLNLIHRAKIELMGFPLNISKEVSLTSYLAKVLLNKDNFHNRVVAVAYFLAKNSGMNNYETLSNIMNAAFISTVGLTQVGPDIDKQELFIKDIMCQTGIKLSSNSDQIINQFSIQSKEPNKRSPVIEAQPLSLSYEIFKSSMLKNSTKAQTMKDTIHIMLGQNNLPRLQSKYDHNIIKAFFSICSEILNKDNKGITKVA